ncbi:methyltransferase family protein [Chloroflexota bacterium]
MIYIATGILGFLILHFFDILCLKPVPGVKPVTWLSGSGLLIYSVIMMSLAPDKLLLPVWSTWLGWGLLPLATFLKIYSLFINLPFRKTYINRGVGDKLVVTGIYALVRYPWIHSFAFILLSLILISRSRLLLIAAPIIILLNILLAVIQDKFFFDKMFPNYDRYRQETPMLLPNRKSISACLRTIKPMASSSAQRRSQQ